MQLTTKTRPGSDQITRVSTRDGVHYVRLSIGELKTHDINRLRTELSALYQPGEQTLIALSLKRVNMLSSACMGMFVEFSNALVPINGSLVLYEVPRDIAKMLKKLKLHKQLPITKSPESAYKLLKPQRIEHHGAGHESAA